MKNLAAILLYLNSQKTSLGETPWLTGHHGMPEVSLFIFLLSPCYLQDMMPCHWSSSDFYRECYGFERALLLSGAFYLTPFLLVSRPSWDRQFNLNISRDSCWYFRNIGPARLFVWITTIQERVYSATFIQALWSVDCVNNLLTGFELFSRQVKHVKGLMHYLLSHRATPSTIKF